MANKFKGEELLDTVKKFSILLVVIAVLIFLILSIKIFSFSDSNPEQYAQNYKTLSNTGKSFTSSMKKAGEVQSKFLGPKRSTGGNGKFIDEVERANRNNKSKKD